MARYDWGGVSSGHVNAIGNSGEVEMRDRDERGGEWRENRREKERRDRRRRRECEKEDDAHMHIQSQVHDVGRRWGRGGVKERRMSASSAIHALFSLLPVALALLVHLPGMEGKVFEDNVAADSNWVFIDKFVFDNSGGGKVSWELKLQMDAAAALPNQKTCDSCTLYFQGKAFKDGCNLLPGLVREGPNRTTCVVRDPTTTLHLINKPIDCAVWDKNMSMEWSSCAQKKYLPSKLLFYNDVENSISDWLYIYRSDMNCDEKSIRAAMSIPLEVGIFNSGELPVLPALKPRYWCVEYLKGAHTLVASDRIH